MKMQAKATSAFDCLFPLIAKTQYKDLCKKKKKKTYYYCLL